MSNQLSRFEHRKENSSSTAVHDDTLESLASDAQGAMCACA
jgi:hypothetical protein